jgi:hypothetical protein
MIRRIALAGAAGALALGALAASGVGGAGAAPVTITNATSANISCTIAAKAKIAPALKNSWKQSEHASDPEPAVVAIPDTPFATQGVDASVSSKAKSIACTGSATDGTNVATITGVKVELGPGTPGVDNPPLQEDNTCTGLLAGTQPGDTAATYTSTVTFKTSGAKLAPTSISGLGIAPSGVGFALTGGTLSGSLAGGNGKTQAYVDGNTLAALTAAPASSTAPNPNPTCQANLKLKTKKGVTTASLKGPKGLKKITIGANLLPPNDQSNVCIRKGSTCP